ncbi:MAG: hypothetical protein ABSA75_13440 [Candidatus Bathyarchaeia archaeon]|jgi:hypothetical protein
MNLNMLKGLVTMEIEKQTEFPEERKGEIIHLESIAWHCNNLLCPYCMEKHASMTAGLSSEIADGKEGDQDTHRQLSQEASQVIDRLQKNKAMHGFTEEDVNFYRDWARTWRRKLSGASADGHNHAEEISEHHKEAPQEKELYARCVAEGNEPTLCRRKTT